MIIIDGLKPNYSVNMENDIEFFLLKPMSGQVLIKILDSNDRTIFADKRLIKNNKLVINLSKLCYEYYDKERLKVEVSDDKNNKVYGHFYTESKDIHTLPWKTSIKNVQRKEYRYYDEDYNYKIIKKFNVEEFQNHQNAIIDVAVLGAYSLKVNGITVNNNIDYVVSEVSKQSYYDSYEISEFLRTGNNSIEIEVGNGWYNPSPVKLLSRYNLRNFINTGYPSVKFVLTLDNGYIKRKITSEDNCYSTTGSLRFNCPLVGEVYDDSIPDIKLELFSVIGNGSELLPRDFPYSLNKEIENAKIIYLDKDRIIYDFGKILSGGVKVNIDEGVTGEFQLRYSESLDANKNVLDFNSTIMGTYEYNFDLLKKSKDEKAIQEDLIIKGRKENLSFNNKFTYHSFRYVEIKNKNFDFLKNFKKINIKAFVSHTNLRTKINIIGNNNFLIKLLDIGINTRLNNIHSYYEDCSREKLGYGGDIVALLGAMNVTLEHSTLTRKVYRDFICSQNYDGGFPQTAPFVGIDTNGPTKKTGSITWQLVVPLLANNLIDNGFINEVSKSLPSLKKHIKYLKSFDFKYIENCCLGDWGSDEAFYEGPFIRTPDQEFATLSSLLIMFKEYYDIFKKLTNDHNIMGALENDMEKLENYLVKEYFDISNFKFSSGTQTSYAFAYKSGIYKKLKKEHQKFFKDNFISALIEKDSFVAGIFGLPWTIEFLSKEKQNDLIKKYLTKLLIDNKFIYENSSMPEFIYDNFKGSLNHAMFTSINKWIIEEYLGIKISEGRCFIENTVSFVKDGDFELTYSSPFGEIIITQSKGLRKYVYQNNVCYIEDNNGELECIYV